ncbi:hypothetical protein DV515_00006925 [Chloebia gouldiae]|uniref:Uncharacterized protein n=1 Tax=Chloebia gouldiae TaxID=44316 RepID=A0A3L8SJ34_CHLGU|nr:hypothetical protein DV515_00006925 [Chloebia gouldiae]
MNTARHLVLQAEFFTISKLSCTKECDLEIMWLWGSAGRVESSMNQKSFLNNEKKATSTQKQTVMAPRTRLPPVQLCWEAREGGAAAPLQVLFPGLLVRAGSILQVRQHSFGKTLSLSLGTQLHLSRHQLSTTEVCFVWKFWFCFAVDEVQKKGLFQWPQTAEIQLPVSGSPCAVQLHLFSSGAWRTGLFATSSVSWEVVTHPSQQPLPGAIHHRVSSKPSLVPFYGSQSKERDIQGREEQLYELHKGCLHGEHVHCVPHMQPSGSAEGFDLSAGFDLCGKSSGIPIGEAEHNGFVLFAVGFNPKYCNAVVRLAGENKEDIMVWGLKHSTGSQFKVQPCVLVPPTQRNQSVSERERIRGQFHCITLGGVVLSKPEVLGFAKAAAKHLRVVKVLPRCSDLSKGLN